MDNSDEFTVMTTETTTVLMNAQGYCVKHPHVQLKFMTETGEVYVKDTCDECQKEYSAQQSQWKQQRAEVDRQLQALERQRQQQNASSGRYPYQPTTSSASSASSYNSGQNHLPNPSSNPRDDPNDEYHRLPLTMDGLAVQMKRLQEMQDWILTQREQELQLVRAKVEEQQKQLMEKEVEIALLKEKLHTQETRMQQELKLLKIAAYHNKRKSGGGAAAASPESASDTSGKSPESAANIHIGELYVYPNKDQDLPEATRIAVSKTVNGTLKPQEQEEVLPKTSMEKEASNQDEEQPKKKNHTARNVAVGAVAGAAVVGTAAAIASSSSGANNNNKSERVAAAAAPTLPKRYQSQGDAPAALGSGSDASSQSKEESYEMVESRDGVLEEEIQQPASPAAGAATKKVFKIPPPPPPGKEAPGASAAAAVPPRTSPMQRQATPAVIDSGGAAVAAAAGTAAVLDAVKESDEDTEEYEKEEGDDTFDVNAPLTHPPESALRPVGKTMMEASKTLPRERVLDQQNTAPGIAARKQFGPQLGGVPPELIVDSDALPTVPLSEQITIGTVGDHAPDDVTMGMTVASSTYGEDRVKVTKKPILDPYGERGVYTGMMLLSTGMPHGYGEMDYDSDHRTYKGEWRHGRWHTTGGLGTAIFANGDKYVGQYKFDQRHGKGEYSWSDGRQYKGDFHEDMREGKGVFTWPDGAIYRGGFHKGKRHGYGRYEFHDGGYYDGNWADGRYEGYGECLWSDGRKYVGEWHRGLAHGKGVETSADGSIRHDGQWYNDEPLGKEE